MKSGDIFNPYKVFNGAFLPNAVMQHGGISSTAKLCWARLAQYAGANGECFPSQGALAAEIGVSVRQVKRVLSELEQGGFIVRNYPRGQDRFQHKTVRYTFLWHSIFDDNGLSGQDDTDTSAGDANVPSEGDADVPCAEDANVPSEVRGSSLRDSFVKGRKESPPEKSPEERLKGTRYDISGP